MKTKAAILAQGYCGPVVQRRVVYLATVLDQFNHADYRRVRRSIKRNLPASAWAIFEPARMPWTTPEWLKAWPRLLRWVDALVIWPRPDGSVGFGVYQEACDVERMDRPVYVVDSNDTLRSFNGFILLKGRSPFRYARVRAGKTISLPALALHRTHDGVTQAQVGKMPEEASHAA